MSKKRLKRSEAPLHPNNANIQQMSWKLTKNISGIDFHLDIETKLNIQLFYSLRLERQWAKREYLDRHQSEAFIKYALRYLHKEFFVVFLFGKRKEHFVQFCNLDDNIVLDIPVSDGNHYSGKEDALNIFFKGLEFTQKRSKNGWEESLPDTFYVFNDNDNERCIRASFGKNYVRAAVATLLLAETIFKFEDPNLFGFENGKLTYSENLN